LKTLIWTHHRTQIDVVTAGVAVEADIAMEEEEVVAGSEVEVRYPVSSSLVPGTY
jgi:hypothetical protein